MSSHCRNTYSSLSHLPAAPIPHRPLAFRIPIVMLLLVSSLLFGGLGNATAETTPFSLYLGDDAAQHYQQIDPLTLQNANSSFDFASEWPQFAISADRSTSVVIEHSTIVVHDGLLGPERLRISSEESLFGPRLSQDGSRLIASRGMKCGTTGCGQPVWHTFDTKTGASLAMVTGAGSPVFPDLVDADGLRIFHAFYELPRQPGRLSDQGTPQVGPGAIDGGPPWPLQIASYDTTTGAELARTTIEGVEAGSWLRDTIDGVPVMAFEGPGIALSPDGMHLAVVDAGLQTITLIATETLEIERQLTIHERDDSITAFLQWLGIAPRSAAAKYSSGRSLSAVFAAHGKSLYVTGYETAVDEQTEQVTGQGLGLLKIDLDSGEIDRKALAGDEVIEIIPSPSGDSVYVFGPRVPYWETRTTPNPSFVLRRLDTEDFETLAEREVPGWADIIVVTEIPPG